MNMKNEKEKSLKEIYDCTAQCSKCKCEYGYDIPKKFKNNKDNKNKFKDDGLCPLCGKNNKEKAYLLKILKQKALYTSKTLNNLEEETI